MYNQTEIELENKELENDDALPEEVFHIVVDLLEKIGTSEAEEKIELVEDIHRELQERRESEVKL